MQSNISHNIVMEVLFIHLHHYAHLRLRSYFYFIRCLIRYILRRGAYLCNNLRAFRTKFIIVNRWLRFIFGWTFATLNNTLLFYNFFGKSAIFLLIRKHLVNLFFSESYHKKLVFTPNTIVCLVLENRQKRYSFPTKFILFCNF